MIEPITKSQFRKYFIPIKGPEGSLLSRIQQQCVETRWYHDSETDRVGVVIYDSRDDDWQCVTLEDYGNGSGYLTHEVRVSIPTESEAIEQLMLLFRCETGETARFTDRMSRSIVLNTGRTPREILLTVPEID
jgi:hypothetical protein